MAAYTPDNTFAYLLSEYYALCSVLCFNYKQKYWSLPQIYYSCLCVCMQVCMWTCMCKCSWVINSILSCALIVFALSPPTEPISEWMDMVFPTVKLEKSHWSQETYNLKAFGISVRKLSLESNYWFLMPELTKCMTLHKPLNFTRINIGTN